MNILILNGSPRIGGNTEIMADAFARSAQESGHQVTKINLAGKRIAGCLGCGYCSAHSGSCVIKDDMLPILQALDHTDMLVFASPIYWFDITGQLKCAIDRMYSKGSVGFHFSKTALLLDSASEGVYQAAISQYKATAAYLHWDDQGIVTINGMQNKGDMAGAAGLETAYRLGKRL